MVGTATSPAKAPHPKSKPILHVECCTNQPETLPRTLADRVEGWLRKRYASVNLKQTFPCLDEFHKSLDIHFITVADLTSSTDLVSMTNIHLREVDISVDVFELHGDEEPIEPSAATLSRMVQDVHDDTPRPQVKSMDLPNKTYMEFGTRKALQPCSIAVFPGHVPDPNRLIFENSFHYRLLNFIIRRISFSARPRGQEMSSWSRIVLLYGPPGTGKTSLCRALAQQLSIRLGDIFPLCKLVECDAHLMFSQYFGESGKIVNKHFAMIESMLEENENTLICVFVDEIESLAGKRQYFDTSKEPQDSLRAANTLLIELDRLRRRPNVLVFCTSNLIEAVDSAFLDRVDVKHYIPDPSPEVRYEILRSCYLELAQCGIIAPILQPSEAATLGHSTQEMMLDGDEDELASGWASLTPSSSSSSSADRFYTPFSSPPPAPQSTKTPKSQEGFRVADDRDLPPRHLMILSFPTDEESLPRTLWNIAARSTNLSARALRRLPGMSLAMYARQDPCPIHEALRALSEAVDNEPLRGQRGSTEGPR